MRNGLIGKGLVLSIILILVCTSVASSSIPSKSLQTDTNISMQKTWIVDDEGDGDFISINEAIDNAADNDIINVYSGEYGGNVTVNKEVEIIGVDIEYMNGDDTGKPIIDEREGFYGFYVTVDSVNITGLCIENLTWGIYIASNNCYVGQNILKNNNISLVIANSTDSKIINNQIIDAIEVGIHIIISEQVEVRDNIFFSCGIILEGEVEYHFDSHIVDNNTINGLPIYYFANMGEGFIAPNDGAELILASCSKCKANNNIMSNGGSILIYCSDDFEVSNNNISNSLVGIFIYDCKGDKTTVSSNNLDNLFTGIAMDSCEQIKIIDNNIFDCCNAITSFNGMRNNITENIIHDIHSEYSLGSGIEFWLEKFSEIYGNLIYNCDIGIELISCQNIIIKCNNIYNNEVGIRMDGTESNLISHNRISHNKQGIYINIAAQDTFLYNNLTYNDNCITIVAGIALVFKNNNIFSPSPYLIELSGGIVIDATWNWWGNTKILPIPRLRISPFFAWINLFPWRIRPVDIPRCWPE